MTALDSILDGIEAELALERELGVRFHDFDRALLADLAGQGAAPSAATTVPVPAPTLAKIPAPKPAATPIQAAPPAPVEIPEAARPKSPPAAADVVYLHDRPLSPEGVTMMAKIFQGLEKAAAEDGLSLGDSRVVIAPPLPSARLYVVLGAFALKRFFPGLKGAPGQWLRTEKGADVLVTYSPAYILRFKEVTPAVQKMKLDMWKSLKGILNKIKAN